MADTINPSIGTVVDADGNVRYDFAGHVHAGGVDIDTTSNSFGEPNNSVRWLDPTGRAAAYLYGNWASGFGDSSSRLEVYATDPNRASIDLIALQGAGNAQLSVDAEHDLARVQATAYMPGSGAGVISKKVIDESGRSDFSLPPAQTFTLQGGPLTLDFNPGRGLWLAEVRFVAAGDPDQDLAVIGGGLLLVGTDTGTGNDDRPAVLNYAGNWSAGATSITVVGSNFRFTEPGNFGRVDINLTRLSKYR